jgi:hypothetical protein
MGKGHCPLNLRFPDSLNRLGKENERLTTQLAKSLQLTNPIPGAKLFFCENDLVILGISRLENRVSAIGVA